MKIVLEAEVMDRQEGVFTRPMYLPGHCAVRLKVVLGMESTVQAFEQAVILRLDNVQSEFDLLMKNLTRNMRDTLIWYLEDRSFLEKFPLKPVLTFQKMRG